MTRKSKDLLKKPCVCGVISGKISLTDVKKAATQGASLIEIRVDTLKEKNPEALAAQFKKARSIKLPILLTIRSVKEGGKRKIDDKERLSLFKLLLPYSDCVDIELSSKGTAAKVVKEARRLKKKVIVSFHDFKKTPTDKKLKEIMHQGRKLGADVVKIACTPRTPKDAGRLFALVLKEKKAAIIAMGRKWRLTRAIFPLYGSLVTYAPTGTATAPGQMPLKELSSLIN